MTTIFIQSALDGGHNIKLQSPDPIVFRLGVDTLKSFVPVPQRRYDPTTKQWTVVMSAVDRLQRWLAYCRTNLHAEIQWLDADAGGQSEEYPPPQQPRQQMAGDAYAALHLLPSAPVEVVRAAYKAMAMLCHPDKQGGDEEQMKRVNAAYKQLAA